jgi:hypothetical protein
VKFSSFNFYLDAVANEFREKSANLKIVLNDTGLSWGRFEQFITNLARLAATDENFLRLMQWVRLDSDEARRHKPAEHVFKDVFVAVRNLVAELDSSYDACMLAMSVIGIVFFSFEVGPMRKFMPGYRSEHDDPVIWVKHIIDLLRTGLSKPEENAF